MAQKWKFFYYTINVTTVSNICLKEIIFQLIHEHLASFFIVHFSFIPKWVKVLGTDEPKVLKKRVGHVFNNFISQFIADIVQIQS